MVPSNIDELEQLLFSRGDGVLDCVAGEDTTRIGVFRGRVAWIHCSKIGVFLCDRLSEALGISLPDLRRWLLECKAAGRRLGEHLVTTGAMSDRQFREVLARHNREHLVAFVPQAMDCALGFEARAERYDPRFTFGLRELLDAAADAEVTRWLDAAWEIPGSTAAVAFDLDTASVLGVRGDPAVCRVAAADRAALAACTRQGNFEQLVTTVGGIHHIWHLVPGTRVCLLLHIDAGVGSLAHGSYALSRIFPSAVTPASKA